MDAGSRPERLNLTLPAAGAIVGGAAVMLAFLIVPAWRLEYAVSASGIPAILAAAEPPLGFTARIALGLVFGGMVAGFAWFGLSLLAGDRPLAMPSAKNWGRYRFDMAKWTALLRRTTRQGDGAPRPPLFANRELGTPFLDVKAPPAPPPERDIPLDLDQPLAAFDPGAVLAEPLPLPEPLSPLARPQIIDPGDRFETFELTPMQRVETPPLRAEPDAVVASRPSPRRPRSSRRRPNRPFMLCSNGWSAGSARRWRRKRPPPPSRSPRRCRPRRSRRPNRPRRRSARDRWRICLATCAGWRAAGNEPAGSYKKLRGIGVALSVLRRSGLRA